jgi:hypothetical protein
MAFRLSVTQIIRTFRPPRSSATAEMLVTKIRKVQQYATFFVSLHLYDINLLYHEVNAPVFRFRIVPDVLPRL